MKPLIELLNLMLESHKNYESGFQTQVRSSNIGLQFTIYN